jgi:hypothetical protein
MYKIGLFAKDSVETLQDTPQSSIGAPCPMIVADEQNLVLAFYLEVRDDKWDGTTVRVVGTDSTGEPHAIVTFKHAIAHFHGPPNDEAFSGHPLQKRGLTPYGSFEIKHSSWLNCLMEMNRVHPYHKDDHFKEYRHFVFSFHDTTFECIAEGFEFSTGVGSLREAMAATMNQMK